MKSKIKTVKTSRTDSRKSDSPKYIRVSNATYKAVLKHQKTLITKKKRHVSLLEVCSELIK